MKAQGIGFILMEKVIGKAKQLLLFQGENIPKDPITTNYIEGADMKLHLMDGYMNKILIKLLGI